MSNGFKWELSKWGDGTTRLVYWDYLHGKDIVVVLNTDGTAASAEINEETLEQTLNPVDLVMLLRNFANDR